MGTASDEEPVSYSTQSILLAIVPKFPAILSIFGSLFIVLDVWRNRKKRKQLSNRIMLGLSCSDIMASSVYLIGTVLIPKGSVGQYGPIYLASGNAATCSVSGFFVQLAICSPLYNGSLCLYYLLSSKYSWTKKSLGSLEVYLHGAPILFAVGTASAGILLNLYGSVEWVCWVNPVIPNPNTWKYQWAFLFVPLWIVVLFVSGTMFTLWYTMRQQEIKMELDRKRRRESAMISTILEDDIEEDDDAPRDEFDDDISSLGGSSDEDYYDDDDDEEENRPSGRYTNQHQLVLNQLLRRGTTTIPDFEEDSAQSSHHRQGGLCQPGPLVSDIRHSTSSARLSGHNSEGNDSHHQYALREQMPPTSENRSARSSVRLSDYEESEGHSSHQTNHHDILGQPDPLDKENVSHRSYTESSGYKSEDRSHSNHDVLCQPPPANDSRVNTVRFSSEHDSNSYQRDFLHPLAPEAPRRTLSRDNQSASIGRTGNGRKYSRRIAVQGIMYILAFYITWFFPSVQRIIELALQKNFFVLQFLDTSLLPLQGLLNVLIFVKPRYLRARKRDKEARFWKIIWDIIGNAIRGDHNYHGAIGSRSGISGSSYAG